MKPKAFVYTELQISKPFDEAPWADLNPILLKQPGLLNKTWLAGVGNESLGGFYAFDSLANAKAFVTGYFPTEAKRLGVAQTTRVFDAQPVEDASRDMSSVHFGHKLDGNPGAFVYTELQIAVPGEDAPWQEINPRLKQHAGLLGKTWLSGVGSQSLGGLYVFDSVENATRFALDEFPKEAAEFGVAFYTRVFDAAPVEAASRQMRSPFFV